jgi:phospholipid/cholesterol/gamma-HCH transport system substrate-binding protein
MSSEVRHVTAARLLVVAALAAVAVLVAVVLVDGEDRMRYTLRFESAGQLVVDDDVQVGGRRVGAVTDIRLTDDNQAAVEIAVDEEIAPLREGTRAVIRATSLSGVANRYIALTPGPNNARALPEGAVLDTTDTTTIVDLDQLFDTLDADTRRSLRRVIRGFGTQYDGKGAQANAAAEYVNPALSTTRRLVDEINRDGQTLQRLLVEGARATAALAERREQLSQLVANANATAGAIAAENASLAEALRRLPATLRRSNSTFVNLRATLDDLDALVDASLPATRELEPFLRELRPLVERARPTIRDLRLAIRRPGADNDLVELVRRTPRLERVASPSLRNTTRALRRSTPVLAFARPYAPELTGWLRDFGQATANYDANGHYARIQPIVNLFRFTDDPDGGLLVPQDPNDRLAGLQTGYLRRCPGAAAQRPADGSAPFRDDGELDCDARLVVPGP